MSIRDRLKRHAVQYDGPDYEYDRHRYHPFTDLAFAILMEDCRPIDVELAEHALYTAVAAEYPFVATSVFAAPHTSDLEGVRERLFDHLQAMSVVSNPDELN